MTTIAQTGRNCSNCLTTLTPVFPEFRRKTDTPQFENTLVIAIEGGYGMYYDMSPYSIILCGSCVEQFLEALPSHLSDGLKSHYGKFV